MPIERSFRAGGSPWHEARANEILREKADERPDLADPLDLIQNAVWIIEHCWLEPAEMISEWRRRPIQHWIPQEVSQYAPEWPGGGFVS